MTKNVTKINMRAGNKIESNLKILLMSDTKITHLYQKIILAVQNQLHTQSVLMCGMFSTRIWVSVSADSGQWSC